MTRLKRSLTHKIKLRRPHAEQRKFIVSRAKRKVIRAGRRGGKTTGAATLAIKAFCKGRRVLYGVPTSEQVERFWFEVKRALAEPLEAGALYKHEGKHLIEVPGTERRIRAKTAYNAKTLRGDYADLLILDEYQDMVQDAWTRVGAPMLLDNNGDAVFIYTAKRGRNVHAKELYKRAIEDTSGRWEAFLFASHANPHINKVALAEIVQDMTALDYKSEILALEIEDDPAALWNRDIIRHVTKCPQLLRVGVGVDPPGGPGTECGIVTAGIAVIAGVLHGYVIGDASRKGSPLQWGNAAVTQYHLHEADNVIGEANFGGDMVERVIETADDGENVAYKAVRASRGKAVRAGPVVALYEKKRVHHVGDFGELEDEMCSWVPGTSMPSPNRIDGLVWVLTDLMLAKKKKKVKAVRF